MGAAMRGMRNAMGVGKPEEGQLTETVESITGQVPSLAYLGLGVAAMVASLSFMLAGRKNVANFIGQWVPTILIMGLYNKVVKQLGSD